MFDPSFVDTFGRPVQQTIRACTSLRFSDVQIDLEKLNASALSLAPSDLPLPRWDTLGIYPESDEVFVSHCFWGSVINFCFGHPPANTGGLIDTSASIRKFRAKNIIDEKLVSGSSAMQSRIRRFFGENPIFARDIRFYLGTFSQFKRCFHGVNSTMPLLQRRFAMMQSAAATLERKFSGDVRNILLAADFRSYGNKSRPGVVDILAQEFGQSFGQDQLRFQDPELRFRFLKRAQLFACMYHGRASQSRELVELSDPGALGPIVDYEIPRGYHAEGVFSYSRNLSAMISFFMPIEANSKLEIEIRAATYLAQLRELEMVNNERVRLGMPKVHIGHLDYYRWMKGKTAPTNPHLCLTTNY